MNWKLESDQFYLQFPNILYIKCLFSLQFSDSHGIRISLGILTNRTYVNLEGFRAVHKRATKSATKWRFFRYFVPALSGVSITIRVDFMNILMKISYIIV